MLGCNKGKITPNNKSMLKNQWGYIEPLVNAKTMQRVTPSNKSMSNVKKVVPNIELM